MHFLSLLWILRAPLILLTFVWLCLCIDYKQKFVCHNAEWIELNEISVGAGFGGYCGEPSGSIMPIYVQVLDLSYTQLKDLPDYSLHTPKYLHTLNLSGNLMTRVPTALQDSHALQVLYFSDNPVTVLDRSRFVMPPHVVLCPLPTSFHLAKCRVWGNLVNWILLIQTRGLNTVLQWLTEQCDKRWSHYSNGTVFFLRS